jgi:para-aminobenzoate synthetase
VARRPLLLAVDGRSGAGKTSLALELAALLRPHLDVEVFHLDSIYPGWGGLDAALDTYAAEVVAPLAAGRTAHWNWWDWENDRPGPADSTRPADVVILEGVGAGAGAARPALDALAWVELPAGARRDRALDRDGETFAPHWDRWAAQEDAYLARDDPAVRAAITVDSTAGTTGAAPLLVRGLRTMAGWETALALVPAPARSALHHRTVAGAGDPQSLFEAAGGPSAPRAMLLESSDHATTPAPGRSRHAILGVAAPGDPVAEHADGVTVVRHGPVTVRHEGPWFRWLAGVWPAGDPAGEPTGVPAPEAPFRSGWMGWLGYGLKREAGSPDGSATRRGGGAGPADALLFRPTRVATVDHRAGTTTLWWSADDDDGAAWADRLAEAVGTGTPVPAGSAGPVPAFALRDSRDRYLDKVRAAQHEIHDGNTYEVCLTTMLEASAGPSPDGAPFDGWGTYRRLVAANRAPFTLYLRAAAPAGPAVPAGSGPARPAVVELLSTSPERFLALSSAGRLVTEPIKGTRPRGATPDQDVALAEELASSAKDRAENIMITDLARNDLSRVAVPGTLATERVCAIESYPTVHQMVSTVTAQLEPGVARAEAVSAAFPPGSMTGAPKISTMEILESLEAGPRGVYSGVAGYLSDDGAADLSVLIRTLVVTRCADPADGGTRLSLGVGGAITADSVPEEEWDEVRTKAHGVLRVLGAAFPEGPPADRRP